VRVGLLGAVEVRDGDRAVVLGGPKPRALIAVLALHAGHAVSLDRLVDALWEDSPAADVRGALYTYVSGLRRLLGDVVVRAGGGYLLDLPPEAVDVELFTRTVAEARSAEDPAVTAEKLRSALALWRGRPLDGVTGSWADAERARLEELRLVAVEERLAAELALGWGDRLVGEVTALIEQHPLRERLHAHRVTALHQAGRRTEALAHYRAARAELVEELGVEPGPELRAAHERVLQADATSGGTAVVVPAQLPTDIADFTGRGDDVRALAGLLSGRTGTAVRVVAVSGPPGAGKSTLARHVAHQVRAEFPGGQLYAHLAGTRPAATDPADVLGAFLRALGVPEAAIPAGLDDRIARYRSELAGRRVLVVLDDAAGEGQVRPLLPGGRGCAVLVTSRQRMGALEGAHQRELGVLSEEEAVRLLDAVVGGGRAGREPVVAAEIARLCGRLPLAVRIAGARLAARPQWPLAQLARRLRSERTVLSELRVGDLEVRGSLALSYAGLSGPARTALRGLGYLELSSFASWLLAPLLGCSSTVAEDVVEHLVDSRLADASGDRYTLHDLTRAFGRERAEAEETREELESAVTRAAGEYLALMEHAAIRMPGAAEVIAAESVSTLDDSLVADLLAEPERWFEAEQTGLVAVVERAAALDLSALASRLAAALTSSSFALTNQFSLWWRTHQAALAAAERTGDRAAEARLLGGLGWLRYEQDRLDESADYYGRALACWVTAGDLPQQARTRLELSRVHRERGDLADAITLLDETIPVLRVMDDPVLLARAHHTAALTHTERGDLPAAWSAGDRARRIYQEQGDDHGVALVLRSLSLVRRAEGDWDAAIDLCERALGVLHRIGDRLMIAYTTQALAKARLRRGDVSTGPALRDGLAVCNEMQDSFGQALITRTLGELELAQGRPAAAKELLEHALHWWDALSLPLWRARTLRDLSVAHAAAGDPAAADAAWAEASAIFGRHGSREAAEPRPPVVPSQTRLTGSPETRAAR
jgi:DNA-binding SARP family transcriptional activator/tetratricopeptide (TPR) repeat protein